LTVEEAIQTSIEYENRVRDVYVEAVRLSEHPDGKKLFQVMADEEQHHVNYLDEKLKEWREKGEVTTEGLKTAIPSKEAIEEEVAKLETDVSGKPGRVEVDFLRKALAVERETSGFYRRMVKELPQEARHLFSRFLEIEEGHLAIVQAQIDLAVGTGYWFDFQEFTLGG
jgi:rubrerythrin